MEMMWNNNTHGPFLEHENERSRNRVVDGENNESREASSYCSQPSMIQNVDEWWQALLRCGRVVRQCWSAVVLDLNAGMGTLSKFSDSPSFEEKDIASSLFQFGRAEDLVTSENECFPCLGRSPFSGIRM